MTCGTFPLQGGLAELTNDRTTGQRLLVSLFRTVIRRQACRPTRTFASHPGVLWAKMVPMDRDLPVTTTLVGVDEDGRDAAVARLRNLFSSRRTVA